MNSTAPLIGALVDFYPSSGDHDLGIRPATVERIDEIGATGTITVRVFWSNGQEELRIGVIAEFDWLTRAASDSAFDSDRVSYWAWPSEQITPAPVP